MKRSRAIVIVVGFGVLTAGCTILAVRSDSQTPMWGVGAGLVAMLIALYYRRRCPECGKRMVFRAEPLRGQASRYRILFDCSSCNIVWDSGEIQDESQG